MECQVCKRQKTNEGLPGGFIFKDENVFIIHFPDVSSELAHRGHIIIEMARHMTHLSEMSEAEAKAVGEWIPKISKALESVLGAEHVYMTRIGDKTPHLHFHFVPRYPGTPKEYWGPLLNTFLGSGPKASPNDMIEITRQLKAFLKI